MSVSRYDYERGAFCRQDWLAQILEHMAACSTVHGIYSLKPFVCEVLANAHCPLSTMLT